MKYLKHIIPILVTSSILGTGLNAQNLKQIAITFDDLPIVFDGSTNKEMQVKIFNDILQTLDKYQVKATGFVVGKKVTELYHAELLNEFIKRGHDIGNHTFNHPDMNKTSIEVYKQDIVRCDSLIQPFLKGSKYFRYPLLHRGDSKTKKEAIYQFLKSQDYVIASVSIDNDEYLYNVSARKAFYNGDTIELRKIGEQYIEHMKSRIKFYTELSYEKLGREMKQVLLLHMNFLNSVFLDELLSMLQEENWTFIKLNEALEDPAYSLYDSYCGKKGLGWLERMETSDTIPGQIQQNK